MQPLFTAESQKFPRRTGNRGRGTRWWCQISHRNGNGNAAVSRMRNEKYAIETPLFTAESAKFPRLTGNCCLLYTSDAADE